MTDSRPILIVAPLAEELKAVRARVGGTQGRLAGRDVLLAVVGDGPRRARRTLRELLVTIGPQALLGIGVAGGLDPSVAWGRVLASASVHRPDGTAPPPDPAWRQRASAAGLPVVPFAVAPRIVPTPDAKAALRRSLGGDVACVDLESGVFAEEAAEAGVPYLVLRAVLDEAQDEIARSILAAQDDDGHVSKAKVVAAALLRPAEIRRLKAVERRVRACAERLADAVEALLGVPR